MEFRVWGLVFRALGLLGFRVCWLCGFWGFGWCASRRLWIWRSARAGKRSLGVARVQDEDNSLIIIIIIIVIIVIIIIIIIVIIIIIIIIIILGWCPLMGAEVSRPRMGCMQLVRSSGEAWSTPCGDRRSLPRLGYFRRSLPGIWDFGFLG